MDTSTVVDILNELLVAEHQSLAPRLLESIVFVSRDTVKGVQPVRRMADQSKEHTEWLTGMILELGGEPGPRFGDPTSADLHYQNIRHALPRLIDGHGTLIRKYSLATPKVESEPRAGELVSRILARHREHTDTLKQLSEQSALSAG